MRLVLLAAATAIISTPAVAAQGKTYSLSKAEARQAMQDYVACSVKAAPDLASKAVIEDWGTEQIVGDGSALLTPGCTKAAGFIAQLRFQPEIFRGMMAEQLALRDPSIAPTKEAVAALPILAYRESWPVKKVDAKGRLVDSDGIKRQEDAIAKRGAAIIGAKIAACLIKQDPAQVPALFATKLDSAEEMAAIKTLAGGLPQCVPAGAKFSFDRAAFRSSLATSYYRLAMAAKGVTWAGDSAASN